MPPIENYQTYTAGMEKSMEDKMFWFDQIPKEEYSTVIDYGCADGTFLKRVREHNPECFICGIDIDDWMLQEAQKKFDSNSMFINEAFLSKPIHLCGEVLNLSSVIHEVYSYKAPIEVKHFWDYVKGHKYVCIRDMCYDSAALETIDIPVLPYKDESDQKRRKEFESIWGSIDIPINFIHYMLKYRYVENWEREVRENYLPINHYTLTTYAKSLGYKIIFDEQYTLPFLKQKVKEDWNYELIVPTHVKMIWKRKE